MESSAGDPQTDAGDASVDALLVTANVGSLFEDVSFYDMLFIFVSLSNTSNLHW